VQAIQAFFSAKQASKGEWKWTLNNQRGSLRSRASAREQQWCKRRLAAAAFGSAAPAQSPAASQWVTGAVWVGVCAPLLQTETEELKATDLAKLQLGGDACSTHLLKHSKSDHRPELSSSLGNLP
jgi:hypothetical protein